MPSDAVLGILVGGRARRMGGATKGLLSTAGGRTIVEHAASEFRAACPNSSVWLLGRAQAYSHLGLAALADDPPRVGPIGGLRSLLLQAAPLGVPAVLIGCDMPYLSSAVFHELLTAAPLATCVAPRADGLWQPLFSRYAPAQTLKTLDACLAAGSYSFQHLLDALGATPLALSAEHQEQLRDWDRPEDLPPDGSNNPDPCP